MSNSSNRGNTRNSGNSGPQNRNQQQISKHVWVVRPSFTIGICRAYLTKEDAFKDFGRSESLWSPQHDYNIDHDIDEERWIIDRSPVWDAEYDVQWELEKLEVRPRVIPQTQTAPPVSTPKVVPVEKPELPTETPSTTDRDAN